MLTNINNQTLGLKKLLKSYLFKNHNVETGGWGSLFVFCALGYVLDWISNLPLGLERLEALSV